MIVLTIKLPLSRRLNLDDELTMARPPHPPVRAVSFYDALTESEHVARHLLIGNGFSISAHQAFSYPSLLEAGGGLTARLQRIFDTLETTDFEVAVEAVRQARALWSIYSEDANVRARARRDIEAIKRHLVRAITRVHPRRPNDLEEGAYETCRDFLMLFAGPDRNIRGSIFTTNYDLLLYWTVARFHEELECDDGFRGRPLMWSEANAEQQNIFHMHGGLHLYENEDGIRKLRSDRPLLDQIETLMEEGDLPIFVAEGSSAQKRSRIRGNDYLLHARRAFRRACSNPAATLFSFGHSLRPQDEHLLSLIGRGHCSTLFAGFPGGLENQAANRIYEVANLLRQKRRDLERPDLDIAVYDSTECVVWEGI